MTEQDRNIIENLIKLNVASVTDKSLCILMVHRYIDPAFNACTSCGPNVRLMFRKLKAWWEEQDRANYHLIEKK